MGDVGPSVGSWLCFARRAKRLLYECDSASISEFCGPDNLPPLEAFALGCPVVAARVSGTEDQLGNGALLFDPADPEDIADKLLSVTADVSVRRRLVEEGARIAAARTPERYLAQIEEILDDFEAMRRCWGRDYRHMW